MMRVALRYLFRVLISLIALLAIIFIGLTIYIRTASFDQLLQREVNGLLKGRYRGQISIGSIQTFRIGRIDLHDLAITFQGRELLHVPVIEIGYALLPILRHHLSLTVAVDRPQAQVVRDAGGKWDLVEALQSTTPPSSTPSAYTVTITSLRLGGGSIEVAPEGLSGPRYEIADTNLDAEVELPPSGLKLDARRFSAHLAVPGLPPADVTLAASYDTASQPASIQLFNLNLATQASSLEATATVTNPSSPTIAAHLTITKLAASDLSRLKGYPLRDDVSGSISVDGTLGALHAVLDLAAGHAHGNLVADADLAHPRQPTYHGMLKLTNLDLARLVLGLKLVGQLDSSAQIKGQGTQLSAINTLTATVKVDARGLLINHIQAGNVNLTADTNDGRAHMAAVVTNHSSSINADVTLVDLLTPSVQAQIETRRLDLRTFTGVRSQQSDLNATFKLDSPRIDPAQLNLAHVDASALLTLARSSLQNVAISNGVVEARLHGGIVNLAQTNLTVDGAVLNLRGDFGVVPRTSTRLAYTIRAQRLAPLLRLAQLKGNGSLDFTGTVNGTLVGPASPSFHAQGTANASGLNLNGTTATHASLTYDLSGIGQGDVPLGRAHIHFAGVASGATHLRELDASTHVVRQKPAALTLSVNLIDDHGNAHSAAASLVEQKGNVSGALTELHVVTPDGPWHLAAPAHFVAGSRSISIDNFYVRNGPRQLALGGTMRIAGPQNITITARDLDLALIDPLLPPNQHPTGAIAADIAIAGTAAAPQIRANLTANNLAMDSQHIGDLTLRADYNPGATDLNLVLHPDRTHQMALTGSVPMTLNWARGFHAHLSNDVALRLYSAGLPLAALAALAPPRTIKDAAGQLVFDLTLSGSPFRPNANGTITLQDIGGQIVPLGLRINDSGAQMHVTPELFTLDRLAIKAGGGSIIGNGTVALTNFVPGALNLTVRIQKFPALHTERYQATIAGELHLSGTTDAPDITGRVDVLNATVHPDLAFLTATRYKPDPTIVVIRPGEPNPPAAASPHPEQGTTTPSSPVHYALYDNLAIDVAIIIHRDSWIRHPDAAVELAGHLHAVKQRHGPLALVGEINTVRGWLTFNSHTFTLASGQILFTGGRKIDPSLNIDAQYTARDYTIDALVTGFASKPQIKLQSTPPLPQSDILSLLLFGTTSSSLGQSQSQSLQQQAAVMAAGAAASTIGQALSSSLGLQDLGLQLNGAAGQGGVGIGRYIGHNTYLSASQSVTGRQVSIQYYLRRWLSLTTATNADGSSDISVKLTRQY